MINLPVVAVVVGGVGFCIWRFFRKRRVTKEQVGWDCDDYDDDDGDDDDYDDDDDGDWQWLVVYDQVKKAQDEQGLVEGEEEPDFLEEEPLKVMLIMMMVMMMMMIVVVVTNRQWGDLK